MELRDYLRGLRRRWLSVLVLTVLTLAGAGAASQLITPQYEARTQLFVTTQGSDTTSDLLESSSFTQQRVTSYVDVVTSDRVLDPVIAALDLETTHTELAERITAEAPPDTVLINITVTDKSATRAADTANAVGTSLIDVIDDLEEPAGASGSRVRVSTVESAVAPSSPSSPDIPLILALGLLVGLAAGLALAVVRESLDTTIREADDVTAVTQMPLLGGLSLDRRARARGPVVSDDPENVRAEAFRQLRTSFQHATATHGARSVVVASPMGGEATSVVTANLAISLAATGARVALVDADLRHPALAGYLGLDDSGGLTAALLGRAPVAELLRPWGEDGTLDVLVAGEVPPGPSELLASPAMEKVLRELESSYEFVLLGGAPLLPVTDSVVLARIADGALIVVPRGRTRGPQLQRAVAALHGVDAQVLGVVLTGLRLTKRDASAV